MLRCIQVLAQFNSGKTSSLGFLLYQAVGCFKHLSMSLLWLCFLYKCEWEPEGCFKVIANKIKMFFIEGS